MTLFRSAVPCLPVSDQGRALRFYEEALGFTSLQDGGADLGILVRDHVELHLWVADGSAPGAERHLAGSASCRFQVDGVEDLHRRCRDLGVVHPRAPLRTTSWGTTEFSVLDPDGNLVGLYQRIPGP